MTSETSLEAMDPWRGREVKDYYDTNYYGLITDDTRLRVSFDAQSRRLFIVVIPKPLPLLETLPKLKGLEFKEIQYGDETHLLCSLTDRDIKEQFGIMVTDVVEKLTGNPDISLRQNVLKRIKEWSQFLKPSRTGITEERLRGLWGKCGA